MDPRVLALVQLLMPQPLAAPPPAPAAPSEDATLRAIVDTVRAEFKEQMQRQKREIDCLRSDVQELSDATSLLHNVEMRVMAQSLDMANLTAAHKRLAEYVVGSSSSSSSDQDAGTKRARMTVEDIQQTEGAEIEEAVVEIREDEEPPKPDVKAFLPLASVMETRVEFIPPVTVVKQAPEGDSDNDDDEDSFLRMFGDNAPPLYTRAYTLPPTAETVFTATPLPHEWQSGTAYNWGTLHLLDNVLGRAAAKPYRWFQDGGWLHASHCNQWLRWPQDLQRIVEIECPEILRRVEDGRKNMVATDAEFIRLLFKIQGGVDKQIVDRVADYENDKYSGIIHRSVKAQCVATPEEVQRWIDGDERAEGIVSLVIKVSNGSGVQRWLRFNKRV
jgi:hypothetical protein